MAKMYYVCNRVDKDEIQCSTLEAAKLALNKCVAVMVLRICYILEDLDSNDVARMAANLFYVKQVDYVREEIIYSAADLEEMENAE